MNTTHEIQVQFCALASHLAGLRDNLLESWHIAEGSPDRNHGGSLTNAPFIDPIEAFAQQLRTWPDEESAATRELGKEQATRRGVLLWQQGCGLCELIREWAHLQDGVMVELEAYALAHPDLEPTVLTTARQMWTHSCCAGITGITAQFWRLREAESAAHVLELERAVLALKDVDTARAATWREATHDLRGSLNAISLAASVLDAKGVSESERLGCNHVLQSGVLALQEMLNDLMHLARLDAGVEERHAAPFDAGMRLSDWCATFVPLAQARGLYLKMEGPATLLVQGDPVKTQRILQNLVLNALKYTQHGGVTVNWGTQEDRGATNWVFTVKDTGPGLFAAPGAFASPHFLQLPRADHAADAVNGQGMTRADNSVPEMFVRRGTLQGPQYPGEGVGLSIVRRLCDLLDGILELRTIPGEGSTFRVSLPLCCGEKLRSAEPSILRDSF